jgi:EmrB/QacA subfamily drug resistance transporter
VRLSAGAITSLDKSYSRVVVTVIVVAGMSEVGPPGSRRWLALAAVVLAVLAVGMDLTVLSVALPTLSGALRASETDLQWFSSGYALVLAAAMLPAGLLGDRFGRRQVMLWSLGLFALGSVACAESRTSAEFLFARMLLGFGGAGVVVMAMSALAVLFTEDERPKAVGVWAAANMVAFPIGPILGGWLLSHYWWGWVFLMNVPAALIGLVAVAALVPESRAPQPPGFDLLGIVLSSGGLVGLTYGFIEAGEYGWGSPNALAAMAAGVCLIAGFFPWERRLTARPGGLPLVDLSLFRSRAFTWGVLLFTVLTLALVGLLFTLPQYFQGVMGTNAEGSGIRLLPVVGGLLVGLVPALLLAKRIGAKFTVALGFAVLAAGLAFGATTTTSSGEGFSALWLSIAGVGTGVTMATTASAAVAELDEERAGVGSAVLQALKNTGAPLGSAVLGSTLLAVYVNHLRLGGLPSAAATSARQGVFQGAAVAHRLDSLALLAQVHGAFVHGMDSALLVSVAFAAAGCVLGVIFLPIRRGSGNAQRGGAE